MPRSCCVSGGALTGTIWQKDALAGGEKFVGKIYAIIILNHIKRAKNRMIIRECALNKMGAAGNDGAKNDKTAMPCHREMAGLLDFAHKVWYATVGVLAQTYRACFGLCRNNNYVSN